MKNDNIIATGLLDVAKDWLEGQRYVSLSMLKQAFSLSDAAAEQLFHYLIEEGYQAKEPTYQRGHKVIPPLLGMEIVLLDNKKEMTDCWEKEFSSRSEVRIVQSEFYAFMSSNDIECVVSPGNAFGYMDGGYDAAITSFFGDALQRKVQYLIKQNYHSEQPIGSALFVDIPGDKRKLIHVPSMRLPSIIKDPVIIYQCTRVALMCALEHHVKSIILPAFGGGCGQVEPKVIASMMRQGYEQLCRNKKPE